jgi:hypothetical protein
VTNAELLALLRESRNALSQGCWNGSCCEVRARIDAALAEPGDRTLTLERQLDDAMYRLAKTREALRAARHTLTRSVNNARFTVRTIEAALPRIDGVLDGIEELP